MAQPTYVTSGAANATGFSFRVAVQLDFGTSGNVAVLAQAFLDGGGSAGNVNSITVGGTLTGGTTTGSGAGARNKDGTVTSGTALTLETEILGASYLGTPGTARAGRISGLSLTGLQWVQVEAYYLGSPSNGTKPVLLVDVWSGVSAIAAGTGFATSATSGAFSQSVTTTADDVAVALFHTTAPDADTFTATSPTELRLRALDADQVTGINGIIVSEPGVAGTTAMVGAFGSATTRPVAGTKWVVQGTAGSGATANGATVTATASLVAGSASGAAAATATGATVTATASLVAGAAIGEITGLLDFQAAGLEFGARTGLGIDTFALQNGISYRYSVHADALTLGAAILTSAAITLDSAGKLPNLRSASLVPATTYRIVAIRQTDGEACIFRMVAGS